MPSIVEVLSSVQVADLSAFQLLVQYPLPATAHGPLLG